jgi:hypothetical protein
MKINADMACWFCDKIQDFHSHFDSFLEPQQVKNISELFNNYLLSNYQSLFTCQVACESECLILSLLL